MLFDSNVSQNSFDYAIVNSVISTAAELGVAVVAYSSVVSSLTSRETPLMRSLVTAL